MNTWTERFLDEHSVCVRERERDSERDTAVVEWFVVSSDYRGVTWLLCNWQTVDSFWLLKEAVVIFSMNGPALLFGLTTD